MKILFLLLLTFATMILISGCDFFDSDSDGLDSQLAIYMPMEVGNVWTYEPIEGETQDPYHRVYRIISTESNGNQSWPLLSKERRNADMEQVDYPDNLYLLEIRGNVLNSITLPEQPNYVWERTSYFSLNYRDKNLGEIVHSEVVMSLGSTTVFSELILLAKDSLVITPAGTFDGCIEIRQVVKMLSPDNYFAATQDLIFAPNTGIIRIKRYDGIFDLNEDLVLEESHQLISFETVTGNTAPTNARIVENAFQDYRLECDDADGDQIVYFVLVSDRNNNLDIKNLLSGSPYAGDYPRLERITLNSNFTLYSYAPFNCFRVIAYDYNGGSTASNVITLSN